MTEKWQNEGAGPRQCKDLQKAIGRLTWAGKGVLEISGVVGGREHRSVVVNLLGGVREDVTAADIAIREKYGYTVTAKNVRAIITDYEAATKEAEANRPVDDQRRTPDEDAEIKARVAERDAEYQAQRDAQDALLTQALAKAPPGAQALIVAQCNVDTSDPMTDYAANRTDRSVAIGFRTGSREDFRQLHAAAARFPETAHLGSEEAFQAWLGPDAPEYRRRDGTERRDNYSMGKGNYLSDHGWDGAGSGWVVKSIAFPAKWANLTEVAIPDAPARPAPGGTTSGGPVTVRPSSLGREGFVEVVFSEKPDAEVRSGLKAHGFRWAPSTGSWYGRDTTYAEALAAASQREEVAV